MVEADVEWSEKKYLKKRDWQTMWNKTPLNYRQVPTLLYSMNFVCGNYKQDLKIKAPVMTTVVCFVFCPLLQKSFLQTVWTKIRLLLKEQSDLGPHCLPICKNGFEKFARIFSRRHKQTIFSDAGFLGALRVKKNTVSTNCKLFLKDSQSSVTC